MIGMSMSNEQSDTPVDRQRLAAERLKKLNSESEKRKRSLEDGIQTIATSSSDLVSFQSNSNARHKIPFTVNETDGGITDAGRCDGSRLNTKKRKRRKTERNESDEMDIVTADVPTQDDVDTLAGNTTGNHIHAETDIENLDQISHVSKELTLTRRIKNQKRKDRQLNHKRLRDGGEVGEGLEVSLESDIASNVVLGDVKLVTESNVCENKKRRRSHTKGENESDASANISKRKTLADKSSDGRNSTNSDQDLEEKERLVTRKETKSMKRRRLRFSKVDINLGKRSKIAKSKPGMSVEKGDDERSAVKEKDDDDEEDAHSKRIGGFTVLKNIKAKAVDKIQRRLPDWLAKPSIISADIQSNLVPLEEIWGLEPDIVCKLRENGIKNFFPVQAQVIPALLDSVHSGAPFLIGKAGYRPRDICCSAPTGSGKTLAFVLPIVQALRKRVVCQVRALIVLPVQDLATQVYKVFLMYCEGTGLKVSLLTGQNTFVDEQKSLVKKSYRGYESLADITIATPGRLVDHLNNTVGFDLRYLRFLVIDEADRMMDDIRQDWIHQLEAAVYCQDSATGVNHPRFIRHRPTALIAANATRQDIPLQKLLFSATLSHNPETLQRLSLFQPRLFTSVVVQKQTTDSEPQQPASTSSGRPGDQLDDKDEYIGKFTTPSSLTELCVECTPAEKPLIVLYLLKRLKYRNVLCFTNTVEATHRLRLLLKFHAGIRVREFSSQLSLARRSQILADFKTGKIHIIICTDQMARGIDIENVRYVLSYDAPLFIKTYIHRVGRTARAGKSGTAVTLLGQTEMIKFRKLLSRAGKEAPELLDVTSKRLKSLVPGLTNALNRLPHAIKREKRSKKSQPKTMKLSEPTGLI